MAELHGNDLAQRVRDAESAIHEAQRQAREDHEQLVATRQAMQQQLQEMVSSFNGALSQMRDRVNEALRQRDQEHQAALGEIRHQCEELEQALEHERSIRERERKAAGEAAREAIMRARHELNALLNLPCEFFASGQQEAVQAQLARAVELCDQQLGQAAASLAESAMTEAVTLGAQVCQAQQEWEQLFRQYRERVETIAEEKRQFEQELFGREAAPISEEDRDYWSSGAWSGHAREAEAMATQAAGMDVFQAETSPLKTTQMISAMNDAGRVLDRQRALMHVIRQERKHSDERFYSAQELAEPLEQAGFNVLEAGFVQDEPMERYEMLLGMLDTEDMLLSVTPVRHEGVVVRNEIVLQAATALSAEMEQTYANAITRVVQEVVPDLAVQRAGEEASSQAVPTRNAPDPQRQVRAFERRYH